MVFPSNSKILRPTHLSSDLRCYRYRGSEKKWFEFNDPDGINYNIVIFYDIISKNWGKVGKFSFLVFPFPVFSSFVLETRLKTK